MNNTETDNNATNPAPVVPMPDYIREQIETARQFAAILTAPAVLAVLDRFDGKTVNRRLWQALTEAAQTVDNLARFYSPEGNAAYGCVAKVHFFNKRFGRSLVWPFYNAARNRTAPATTATGARLDAAAIRADFERVAAENRKTADQLEEQGARFGEFVEAVRALGRAAVALHDSWRPEFRQLLYRDPITDAAQLANATPEDFHRQSY